MGRIGSLDTAKAAPVVLCYGIAAVYVWFGITQLIDPRMWVGWVPEWMGVLGIANESVIIANGIFEVVFGTLLGLGLFTRVVAELFTIHMLVITIDVGFTAIGVRDFGLVVGSLSILLHGPDVLCLDRLRKRRGVADRSRS